jgi:alpha-tubulin suppressor-like RCC1 family protein
MPNQFLSDEFGDIEDYFVTDYWLIDQFVGDQLFVWGRGTEAQLGVNDTTNRFTAITTFAGGTTWKQVSGGRNHTSAIKTDGSLWTWGLGTSGQLGTNDANTRSTPVTTFAGGNNWKQVSTGNDFTAAIKTDGSLWLWGAGGVGQLGNFASINRSTPVTTFAGGNNWKQVSVGGFHTVAIKTDGSLWGWGGNREIGVNVGTGTKNTPVTTFAGGTNWKQVSCGYQYAAAIKTDGSLWTWGANEGHLGTNDGTQRLTPVTTFAGGNNWKSIFSGHAHITAIKTDGSLWTWGLGTNGRLGNNAVTTRSTPVTTFSGGTNWKQVSAGENHTAAIKTDGTLWTWGIQNEGRLGTAFGPTVSTPVTTFAGGNNWKQVVAGRNHTTAVKSGLNVDLS